MKCLNILKGLDDYDPSEQDENTLSQVTKLALYVDSLQAYMDLENLLHTVTANQEIPRVDELDQHGRAPLHWIVGQNYETGCESLLQEKANINVLTKKEGFTPLMVSCRKGGSAKVTLYLLQHKASHSLQAKSSATAFHIAVASGNRNCMRLLILYGANPFVPLDDRRTAVDLAPNERIRSLVFSCYRSAVIYREKYERLCSFCGKKAKKLSRCGKCYVELYCNRNCQLDHWTKEHFENCRGSVTTAKMDFQSKTALNKIKVDKTFVFKVTTIVNGDVTLENEQKTLRASISRELYNKTAALPTEPKAPAYYWAKFTDSSRQELRLYLGRVLPRVTYIYSDEK